jgi:hypothetical protein
VRFQGEPNDPMMIAEDARVILVAQSAQKCCRSFDIGEEKGKRFDWEMLRDLFKVVRTVGSSISPTTVCGTGIHL